MAPMVQKPVIVLDAGGVLIEYDVAIVYDELFKRYHLRVESSSRADLDTLIAPLEVGKKCWRDILPFLNRRLGVTLSPEAWKAIWCSMIIGEMPGMREALVALKPDFHLVALSNTIDVHWTYLLETYSIFALLDGWVVSYREGAVKPDPTIFKRLQDRYCQGRIPFFFTDDTALHVEAARKLGWPAKVFQDAADFLASIHGLRVQNLF